MKRVLVTGATGFIGRFVVPLLRERGCEVHAVGRTAPSDPSLAFHRLDLLAPEQVQAAVATLRPSHLLHLAWYAEPGLYWKSPRNLDWAAASLHLIRTFAEGGGERALVAGTCAEYEWGAPRFHETGSPCAPATLYGSAKDGLRRILESYAAPAGLSLAWARVFYLYGPTETPGRLVSDAVRRLLAGKRFPTSPGHQKRDFLHVADVAGAFAALLDGDVTGAVNIGSGQAVPVRAVLDLIGEETGRPDLLGFGEKTLSPGEPAVIEAGIGRLRDEVGFVPRYELQRGLRDTIAWWREQHQRELRGDA